MIFKHRINSPNEIFSPRKLIKDIDLSRFPLWINANKKIKEIHEHKKIQIYELKIKSNSKVYSGGKMSDLPAIPKIQSTEYNY